MPTLEDWLALDLDEEDRDFVTRLFERRPEWLATGRLTDEILVWFDSEIPDRPLYLDLDEYTVVWNVAHEHLDFFRYEWPPVDLVGEAIDRIESVLAGRLVQIYAETPEGKWQRAGFASVEEVDRLRTKYEARGWIVTVTSWPGRTAPG